MIEMADMESDNLCQ